MLFLESVADGHTTRIGINTYWGGTITEVSWDGVNFVNANDPGRMIQTSLWDGNDTYGNGWVYNPYQAGDSSFHPSPVIAQTITADSIYTKTWPLQWSPWYGGGTGAPLASDAIIEQTITPVPGWPNGFRVHMKVAHFGTDEHALATQEYPVVYANRGIDTFIYYGGTEPWTGAALAHYTMPYNPARGPQLYTPENWGGYVDANDVGLFVFMPGSYPWMYGFNADGASPGGTNHFVGTTPMSWSAGLVVETDFYVFAGPVTAARAAIYALHEQQPVVRSFPPLGYSNQLPNTGPVGGMVTLGGWATALTPIVDIGVYVDGLRVGTATQGLMRPDVSAYFPHMSDHTGFSYELDTTVLVDGAHAVIMRATDADGRVSAFATNHITTTNPNHVAVFIVAPTDCTVAAGAAAEFAVTALGNPAPTLRWQRSPVGATTWTDLNDGGFCTGVTTSRLTVFAVTSGMDGDQFRCMATNTAGSVPSSGARLSVASLLVIWRQLFLGTTADAGSAANDADPDLDGRCNLLEYALGSVPTTADSGRAAAVGSVTDGTGTHLTLTFNRIADPTLTYTVEASDDLTYWSAIGTSTGAQNVAGSVVVTDSETVENHPHRFLRLRVTN